MPHVRAFHEDTIVHCALVHHETHAYVVRKPSCNCTRMEEADLSNRTRDLSCITSHALMPRTVSSKAKADAHGAIIFLVKGSFRICDSALVDLHFFCFQEPPYLINVLFLKLMVTGI